MDLFSALANQISSAFGIGQEVAVSQYGYPVQRSPLGQLANVVADPSAERRYVEEGFVRLDPVNVGVQQFELMLQEPSTTVLVKKRAFCTLSENYRLDFMNAEEKLYIKATTLLFQNKCNLIQNFEKLSKIAQVANATGQLDTALMPMIIDLVENATNAFSSLSSFGTGGGVFSPYNVAVNAAAAEGFSQLSNVVQQIRNVYAFSQTSDYTSWIANATNPFQTTFGAGTGVIELTNVISIETTTTVNFNQGGDCTISIADPYKMMLVTDSDIEWAISDALNFVANNAIYQLGTNSLSSIAANDIVTLNAARGARGASNIEFISGPDPVTGTPTVTAIIEGNGTQINFTYSLLSSIIQPLSGGGVTIDPSALQAALGFEGLSEEEAGLFSTAVSDQYAALNLTALPAIIPTQPLSDPSGQSTLDVNYVRRKLRFHYGNKLIIQPMDQVHIWMSSKSQTDKQVLGSMAGAFGAFGFLSQAGNTITNIANQFSTAFQTQTNIDMGLEKDVFVGKDFPSDIWAMMRNTFISDKNGCHVFAGIVASASESYVPGNYTVSIGAKDNTHFFDFGAINLTPGLDTFNGPLFDPVTPFVTNFDNITTNFSNQVPQFLPENAAFLGTQTYNSGLIRYNSGSNFGKPATASNFYLDKQIDQDGTIRSIYHMPNGLVYEWKQGIGTYVFNADSFNSTNPANIGIPSLTRDPFAGQDIVNILSLLVTGTPYNYATYFKAVNEYGGGAVRDPQSGQGADKSFYGSISTNLQKQNLLWGGFIPFKSVTIDEQTAQAMMFRQANISQANSIITDNLTQLQNLQSKLILIQANPGTATDSDLMNAVSSIQAQMNAIQSTITAQTAQIHTNLQTNLPITVAGNDVTFSPSQATSGQTASNPTKQTELRRETNLLTRRLSWQVRANQDKNYLMIDDAFEKDPDIISMGVTFAGKLNLFSNEYKTVRDQIGTPAGILNLEVFADTQGHIRIRPQQYNRMPSSVFYRMMQMQQNNSIQIYPSFLQTLFVTQLGTLLNQLAVLELEMRLDGAVLGISDDLTLAAYMTSSGFGIGKFQFISDQNGNITNISAVQSNADPVAVLAQVPVSFDASIKAQGAVTSVFNAADRANLVVKVFANPFNNLSTAITSTYINTLLTLIFQKSGQQVTLDNFIQPTQSGIVVSSPSSVVDVVAVTADLGTKASQRQQLLLSLSNALSNAREAATLNANPTNTANTATVPNLYGNPSVPQVFQNMLEDETYDDLGPGSGTRYVIHDYQIISLELAETPTPFNYVEVQGQLDILIDKQFPEGFNGAFPKGGNATVTAAAIDYDMWQQYGLNLGSSPAVAAPFFSSAENQCAPYAAMLLSRARKDILQGSLVIAGNEFMQPGEVIYVESRGLLFYVESVRHSYSSGDSFRTTLKITYGHNPGEFIPTPLDIIGKLLYNNRDTASSVAYRNTTTSNEISLGAIVLNPQSAGATLSSSDAITGGPFGSFNQAVINNILYTSAGVFNSNQTAGTNLTPMIELRIFFNSKNGAIPSSLTDARSAVQSLLTGTQFAIPTTLPVGLPTDILLQSSQVITADIDTTSTSEFRSPSQKAVDAARNVSASFPGAGGAPMNPIGSAMSGYIIDCVITLTNATPTSSGSTTPVST